MQRSVFGTAPASRQPGYDAPLASPMPQMHPLVQALLNQPAPAAAGNPMAGFDAATAAQYAKLGLADKNNPLLGGAQAGDPRLVNALRFWGSDAQGVNPWTYGQGAVPGGTDTAGNYQV